MKKRWEELRDLAARRYEQDAGPKPMGVIDLAKMLLDGVMIVDQKQFRMIAHSIICMNVALDDARGETRRAKAEARIATQKFRRVMSVYKSMRARIKKDDSTRSHTMKVPSGVVYRALNSVSFDAQMSASRRICEELSALPKAGACPGNAEMNENRASIIDRIIAATSRFAQETGRTPSVVYLGEDEIKEVRLQFYYARPVVSANDALERKEICGYHFVEVKEESYLAVG
ncbi:MAG: hypothetical protein EOM03_12280 [Clostridia bacterium]|nr:hypothetical protein [Clostridia bacterium]